MTMNPISSNRPSSAMPESGYSAQRTASRPPVERPEMQNTAPEYEPPVQEAAQTEQDAYVVDVSDDAKRNAAAAVKENAEQSRADRVQKPTQQQTPTLRDTMKDIRQARELVSYLMDNILTQPQQAIAAQARVQTQDVMNLLV